MILEWGKHFLAALSANSTLVIALVGGAWAYWRFELKQERYPHIEASAAINFIGVHKNNWVVELIGYIDNKGAAQHKMLEFNFTLLALDTSDKLAEGDDSHEVEFPRILKEGSFILDFEYFVVNAGVKAKYSFVTAIPQNVAFARLKCEFKYADARNFSHAFECTIAVPPIATKPS